MNVRGATEDDAAAIADREVGVYERHGRLDGRWMDLLIVEQLLSGAA